MPDVTIPYYNFTSKSRLDKMINTLLGIIEGISIDFKINKLEIRFLNDWIAEHEDVKTKHPYNELIPIVESALQDGVLTNEEYIDIKWLTR